MSIHNRVPRVAMALAMAMGVGLVSQSYAATPLHHWRFDETTGASTADSVGTLNGTLVNFNNTIVNQQWIGGTVGGALNLTPASDPSINNSVDIGTGLTTVNNTTGYSVSVWVKLNDIVAGERNIFSTAPIVGAEVNLGITGAAVSAYNGHISSGGNIKAGIWSNLVLTNSVATGKRLYLNGQQVLYDVNYGGNAWNNTVNAQLGAFFDGNARFVEGKIDDVTLWSGALTSTEVSQIHQGGYRGLDAPTALATVAVPTYDFATAAGAKSLDGWTVTNQSSAAQPRLQVDESWNNLMDSPPVLSTARNTVGGAFVGDNAHDILVARSPTFQITTPGSITWESVAGGLSSVAPTTGTGAYAAGALGVSLVRASDGFRVMTVRTAQEGHASPYAFKVTPLVNDGNNYYLEVVDNFSGGWGYVEWDTFSLPQAAAVGQSISLIDPIVNDGSFESNTAVTVNANPTVALSPVWTISETGTGGVLGHGAHDARFKSDGSDAIFSDDGTTTATSWNLLGSTFYTDISEGDAFEWSFDFNSFGDASSASVSLDFGNGAILLGTGITGDADLDTFHRISGTYFATALDAAGNQLIARASITDVNGNIYGDNFRLSVTQAAAVPEPASLALFTIMGLFGAGYLMYRRKR